MAHERTWPAGLILSFASTLACTPELALETWQGEHVVYEADPSFQVCLGTHAWVDGFVPFVEAELGLDAPEGLTYRWLAAEDLSCRDAALGCLSGGVALSTAPFVLHELVHSVMDSLDYPYQPFFGEGLAFALDPWTGDGIDGRYLGKFKGRDTLVDPRPFMTFATQDLNYYVAGSFVLFLLARHGPATFLDFTRALGKSRDMEVIERTFAAAYGISLDEEAELFMTGAPCTPDSFGPGLYDCTSPEVPWDDDIWSLRDTMDCSSDLVAGGVGPEGGWNSVRSVTLEVPTSGRYVIQATSDDEMRVLLGPCSSCPWERRDRGQQTPWLEVVDLEAGVHFVRIQAQSNRTPSFRISLLPIADGDPP